MAFLWKYEDSFVNFVDLRKCAFPIGAKDHTLTICRTPSWGGSGN